jgi:hypothetical protein
MNVGATLRTAQPVNDGPYISGRRVAAELACDDRLHGAEEKTQDHQQLYSKLGTSTTASLVPSLMVLSGAAAVPSR